MHDVVQPIAKRVRPPTKDAPSIPSAAHLRERVASMASFTPIDPSEELTCDELLLPSDAEVEEPWAASTEIEPCTHDPFERRKSLRVRALHLANIDQMSVHVASDSKELICDKRDPVMPEPHPFGFDFSCLEKAFQVLLQNEHLHQPSQQSSLKRLNNDSGWLQKRASLIPWVLEICDSFHLGHTTAGCVLNYLERAIDHSSIAASLPTAALAVVLIGSKFCESHPCCIQHLQRCVPNMEVTQIRAMERMILTSLGWQLNVVTTNHFVALMLQSVPKAWQKRVAKYAELAADLSALDVVFLDDRRSVLAMACMLTALDLSSCSVTITAMAHFYAVIGDTERVEELRSLLMDRSVACSHVDRSPCSSPENVIQLAQQTMQI